MQLRLPLKFIDVEVVFIIGLNLKKWAFPSISLFEVNVAEPPRRKLDDVRCTIRVGPIGLGLITAHYRGPQQKYEI